MYINTVFNSNLPVIYRDIKQIWNDPIFQAALQELLDLVDEIVENQGSQ